MLHFKLNIMLSNIKNTNTLFITKDKQINLLSKTLSNFS